MESSGRHDYFEKPVVRKQFFVRVKRQNGNMVEVGGVIEKVEGRKECFLLPDASKNSGHLSITSPTQLMQRVLDVHHSPGESERAKFYRGLHIDGQNVGTRQNYCELVKVRIQ